MLQGEDTLADIQDNDDLQYVIDLGLVRRDPETGLQISSAIYREVIPREITYLTQIELESTQRSAWYIDADRRLDMNKLLAAFPAILPRKFRNLAGAIPIQGSRSATVTPGISATCHQRWRTH